MLFGLAIVFLLLGSTAYAQIPTCVDALKASPQGPFPCSVTATWTDNSGNETGFILERSLNNAPFAMIGGGPLAANVTSVVDATLTQSATVDNVYRYRVMAANSAGRSAPSNIGTFTIPQAVSLPPAASNLVITFKGATGELDLTPGRKVKLDNDDGTFVISASQITVDLK